MMEDSSAEMLARRIEDFLAVSADAVLIEPGEAPFPLVKDRFRLTRTSARLSIEVWDENRNLVRRITRLARAKPGALELVFETFRKRDGRLLLIDRARNQHQPPERKAARLVLRERLRAFLRRQFTGWHIRDLSAAQDLEHSLSPVYPRAMVTLGGRAWAAIACPPEENASLCVLTYGLIWLDYLRRRERGLAVEGLALLLPQGHEQITCLRLRWMHPRSANFAVFLFDSPNWEERIDPAIHGNLDTGLPPASAAQPASVTAEAPEATLELSIRSGMARFDPALYDAPVYGQVITWAGSARGILDLLAVGRDGRLAVLELKASPDPNLPLQALDYWMRVRHHHAAGDFERLGYFPGIALAPAPPRLTLVAPALGFHPVTETILRYFASSVEVERIGVALEWQRDLRVLYRVAGSGAPR